MVNTGARFEDALKEAQALGYAEQNPTADISGADACRKICILSSLIFGFHVYPEMVRIEGVEKIALPDITFARAIGRRVKLLGRAVKVSDRQIYVSVAPYLIPADSPLATIDDVFNGIMVVGNAIDRVMFYGPGAGKLTTASAVVADVIDAAKHKRARKWMDWEEADPSRIANCRAVSHSFYVRLMSEDITAALEKAKGFLGVCVIEPRGRAARRVYRPIHTRRIVSRTSSLVWVTPCKQDNVL